MPCSRSVPAIGACLLAAGREPELRNTVPSAASRMAINGHDHALTAWACGRGLGGDVGDRVDASVEGLLHDGDIHTT